MLGWTQEMISDRLNMPRSTVIERIETEIPDLVKLSESRLKSKNPGDLTNDEETPLSEVLAWARARGGPQR